MKTIDKMLKAATTLLLTKGVEATSVDDVLKATKTGKSQFYHYFGNKAGMVDHVIDGLLSDINKGEFCDQKVPAIRDWADFQVYLQIMGGDHFFGHPLALLSLTIRPEERLNHLKLVEYFEALVRPIANFLKSEQDSGRFLKTVDTTEMAQMCLTNMIGCSINKVIEQDKAALNVKNAAHHTTIYMKAYTRV